MTKCNRTLPLLRLLACYPYHVEALARELRTTPRTVRRLINALRAHVRVQTDGRGYYWIEETELLEWLRVGRRKAA